MPRQTRAGSSTQNAYNQQLGVSLAPSPMYTQQRMPMQNNNYFNMPATTTSNSMQLPPNQQPLPTTFDTYTMTSTAPAVNLPQSHRPSSGAWTIQDDQQLMQARAQGLNWNQIRETYFKGKTPNACRKRHERLAERRDADDWDMRKFQRLAKEYMAMRREIWTQLANKTGDKWNVVEHKIMSNGIKNIQSAARAASRHQSQSAAGGPLTGYDDDSGISGIALTPVDELDASYSSPETSSSAGAHSASSSTVSQGYPQQHHPHHHHHPHHQHQQHAPHPHQHQHHQLQSQQHVQLQAMAGGAPNGNNYLSAFGLPNGYGASQPQHRYSSSVSSNASAGNPYANGGASSESSSPYMHGQRLPSVDMGIGAIINRTGGHGPGPV